MASLGGNMIPPNLALYSPYILGISIVVLVGGSWLSTVLRSSSVKKANDGETDQPAAAPGLLKSFFLFFYTCFLKPHTTGSGEKASQQDALESFYKTQAGAYDATRRVLLKGREDLLALVAAQLERRAGRGSKTGNEKEIKKPIWVDVGGGTGYNIEAMARFVDVPSFFSSVYLVDFSPSLCDVARRRFQRLGWGNVHVICEDARKFRLEHHELSSGGGGGLDRRPHTRSSGLHCGADLITMSYSLSMIPDYYSVIDSLETLLSPNGILGVIDFYIQSDVDFGFRNFTAGVLGRHVGYLTRSFWRAWFDLDRVSLEPGRRDYLEYRFGTILGANLRNRSLGAIPYYVWIGCHKLPPVQQQQQQQQLAHELLEEVDAIATEGPYPPARPGPPSKMRSKSFAAAAENLAAGLPLPSSFYQNNHHQGGGKMGGGGGGVGGWRLHYDETLRKHAQFGDEYIYAFTWEDARADEHILGLGAGDVVLAITSAGDNILSYLGQGAGTVHAVDLNPSQNHLLELKAATLAAGLPYDDFWHLFGEGKHGAFREVLLSRLSPYLSSRAFQYWLANAGAFAGRGGGLYDTGGSRHAIRIVRWVTRAFGCGHAVKAMLECKTLNEQREVWRAKVRPALLSRLVCKLVVSQETFLWAALGVPKNQLAMIEADHVEREARKQKKKTAEEKNKKKKTGGGIVGTERAPPPNRTSAVWNYMVDTLDPVAEDTHIALDNPYYHVALAGRFSRRCHPDYLSPRTHARLSRPGALDGRLRIHTDELDEVLARMTPGALTAAVVMDSMDWFDRDAPAAARQQAARLNRALAMGGRVLLRSAARRPWYVKELEAQGFRPRRVGVRGDGQGDGEAGDDGGGERPCIDRVNMYASCWLLTKVENLPPPTPEMEGVSGPVMGHLELADD